MTPPADGGARLVPQLLLGAALLSGCNETRPAPGEPIRVAAAADLTLAFEELGRLFEHRTGQRVVLSFGASGVLAKQLGQGAPFDLFAAANARFVDDAVESGACDGSSKARYARGHLVVWTRGDGPRIEALDQLTSPQIQRISIANPEHAPYGKAAREALVRAGLWDALAPKIVQAENVRQAMQFAETGNVEAAIVARSLVASDQGKGQRFAVDPRLHEPIEQTLVICRHGKNMAGARAFARLLESNEGRALLERHGLSGPTEEARK